MAIPAVLAALILSTPAQAEETTQQIIDAAIEHNATGFQTGTARLTITVETRAGEVRVRTLRVRSKRTSEGQRTLVKLLSPDEVKGQGFLFREVQGGEDLVYWYLPAFGVTRRVSGEGKRGQFMGTHLTYADMESGDVKDAVYKRKADEKVGKFDVYVIEAAPKKTADSEYSKVVMYIRKSDKMPLKVRFFAKNGKEDKVLFTEKLDTKGDRTYVKQMSVKPAAGGFTRITVDTIDFDREIPDVVFTPEALANE
jgi:outer membrane lipoprotein-sorting protein